MTDPSCPEKVYKVDRIYVLFLVYNLQNSRGLLTQGHGFLILFDVGNHNTHSSRVKRDRNQVGSYKITKLEIGLYILTLVASRGRQTTGQCTAEEKVRQDTYTSLEIN